MQCARNAPAHPLQPWPGLRAPVPAAPGAKTRFPARDILTHLRESKRVFWWPDLANIRKLENPLKSGRNPLYRSFRGCEGFFERTIRRAYTREFWPKFS